jgi:hypothetical protein
LPNGDPQGIFIEITSSGKLKGESMKVFILFVMLFCTWDLSHAADRPGPYKSNLKEVETGIPVSSTTNTVTYETSNGSKKTYPRVNNAPATAGAIPVSSTTNTITYEMKDGSRKTYPRVK